MEYNKQIENGNCEVSISGKFTFSDHQEFKSIFAILSDKDIKSIHLDFENVEFIDSAALGILLLARDESEKTGTTLVLQKPTGQVKKMFEVSRFYDLFQIED